MVRITPSGQRLGATVEDLDLAEPLSDEAFDIVLRALGRHGVLRFPDQDLTTEQQMAFSARFGSLEISAANMAQDPDHPEVMYLSNMVDEASRPLGTPDAGQGWHTDMSYSSTISLANVMFAIRIPHDDRGRPLGRTRFADMQAAYDDLPAEVKRRLAGRTAVHDFSKFWEMMRLEKGSKRPPFSERQRRQKPPVSQPIFLDHPITNRKVLYANPGYVTRINGLPEEESDELLAFLIDHQLEGRYVHDHDWVERDLVMWDNIGNIHNALADYGPQHHRMIRRCQVIADWIFANPVRGAA